MCYDIDDGDFARSASTGFGGAEPADEDEDFFLRMSPVSLKQVIEASMPFMPATTPAIVA
jgi:hypothetical protein